MNHSSDIHRLLQKFVLNQCSEQETELVIQYCRDNKLTNDFPTVKEVKQLLTEKTRMEAPAADRIFASILSTAKQEEEIISISRKRNQWKRYTAIAASFIVFLTIGWFYQQDNNAQKTSPVLSGNEITLQMANGDIQVISENGESQLKDANGIIVASQNKGKIVYDTETAPENLVYNTIKIPYGKRFELILSDGTNVHLNSGTTLKYPVKFIAGQNRTVYLDGEAFFDVTKDKTHPFVVNADALNVRVLGTHFNVCNYPEDDRTDVVLVEGSVGLHTTKEKFDAAKNTVLEPGYKASFSKSSSLIKTKPVSTQVYTAWIKGELVFRNMSFKNICKKLERHYNISIENQNHKLENERFNASFKNEPIENVLGYFNELHGLKYTITKNTITIK